MNFFATARDAFQQAAIGVAMLLAGCASTGAKMPADQVRCYSGTSEVHLLDGRTAAKSPNLARRTLMPSKNMIVEDVIVPSGRPGSTARQYIVEMTVTGNTLTMIEKSGAFTGTGTLTGPAWAWTSWRTESLLPNGARVVSTDTLTPGGLSADKQVFDPAGQLQVTTVDRFSEISDAEFERQRLDMLMGRPDPTAKPE